MATRRQSKKNLYERLRITVKARLHQVAAAFKQNQSRDHEDEDFLIPATFATRMARAIAPDISGVGEGLSPVEELRAKGAALLAASKKRTNARTQVVAIVTTERNQASAAVLTAQLLARVSRKEGGGSA